MYSVLPASVANELRHGRPVAAEKYSNVTVLFSGIVGFSDFCTRHSDSIDLATARNATKKCSKPITETRIRGKSETTEMGSVMVDTPEASTGAMAIVRLLNDVYTRLDELVDSKVYKVETVADKYMAVSGLPDICFDHALCITRFSLNMMDAVQSVVDPYGFPIQVSFDKGSIFYELAHSLPH